MEFVGLKVELKVEAVVISLVGCCAVGVLFGVLAIHLRKFED